MEIIKESDPKIDLPNLNLEFDEKPLSEENKSNQIILEIFKENINSKR